MDKNLINQLNNVIAQYGFAMPEFDPSDPNLNIDDQLIQHAIEVLDQREQVFKKAAISLGIMAVSRYEELVNVEKVEHLTINSENLLQSSL